MGISSVVVLSVALYGGSAANALAEPARRPDAVTTRSVGPYAASERRRVDDALCNPRVTICERSIDPREPEEGESRTRRSRPLEGLFCNPRVRVCDEA